MIRRAHRVFIAGILAGQLAGAYAQGVVPAEDSEAQFAEASECLFAVGAINYFFKDEGEAAKAGITAEAYAELKPANVSWQRAMLQAAHNGLGWSEEERKARMSGETRTYWERYEYVPSQQIYRATQAQLRQLAADYQRCVDRHPMVRQASLDRELKARSYHGAMECLIVAQPLIELAATMSPEDAATIAEIAADVERRLVKAGRELGFSDKRMRDMVGERFEQFWQQEVGVPVSSGELTQEIYAKHVFPVVSRCHARLGQRSAQ
jgi:hypothetical protein